MTDPIPTTWATVADVKTMTGIDVTEAEVAQAQFCIDLVAGRLVEDRDRIGTRDQYWLKCAVAAQAPWIQSNPDVFERILLDTDGTGASSTKFGPDGLTYAPYTQKALRQVSWLRSRSLHVRQPGENRWNDGYDSEDNEPGWGPWRRV